MLAMKGFNKCGEVWIQFKAMVESVHANTGTLPNFSQIDVVKNCTNLECVTVAQSSSLGMERVFNSATLALAKTNLTVNP